MNNDIRIISMTRRIIPELVTIENECFSHPWTYDGFEAELDNEGANFFAADIGGKIVGYMGFHAVLDEGYVDNIAVLRDYRRKGIGRTLMEYGLEKCRELGLSFLSLEVRSSNEAAIDMYRKFGFEQVGVRKSFYRAPTEDALIMTIFFGKDM